MKTEYGKGRESSVNENEAVKPQSRVEAKKAGSSGSIKDKFTKDNIAKALWSTKQKKIATCAVSGLLVLGLVGGTVFAVTASSPKYDPNDTVITKEEEDVKEYAEADLEGVVAGLGDMNIVQNAEGIDYLAHAVVDNDIVKSIEADTHKVDLATEGDYDVTYKINLDGKKLAEKLNDTDAHEDAVVMLDKVVHVVTPEKAQELADAGEIVYTTNNEVVTKTDGTVVEAPQVQEQVQNATSATEVKKEPTTTTGSNSSSSSSSSTSRPSSNTSTSNNATSNNNANTNTNTNTNTNSGNTSSGSTSSGSTSSGSTSSGSSSSGSTTTKPSTPTPAPAPSTPVHTHNWVHHASTGHYETQVVTPAYTEQVKDAHYICNGCGKDMGENIDGDHIINCGRGTYRVEMVVVNTVTHPAVTKQVWVQDSAAYDSCSCGATK